MKKIILLSVSSALVFTLSICYAQNPVRVINPTKVEASLQPMQAAQAKSEVADKHLVTEPKTEAQKKMELRVTEGSAIAPKPVLLDPQMKAVQKESEIPQK
jgi:hypothetical protein